MSRSVSTLAALGGPPAFQRPLHVGTPNVPDHTRFLELAERALADRRLTNDGPFVQELESRVAALAGVEHCQATCNATAALGLVVRALGLTGEVIVPSFTFVATPHALTWHGLRPVFYDIHPETFQLDPRRVDELVGPRTSAILGVHVWGHASAAPALEEVASAHGLALVFDAAHAFGCSRGQRSVGSFGDAEVFSFHATKVLSTLEGGAVVTQRADVAERVRRMRNFGFTDYDEVSGLGINAKMDELSAAFGLASLDELDAWVAVNRETYRRYHELLDEVPDVRLVPYDETDRTTYHYVVIEIGPDARLTRDELKDALWAENVLARRYFHPGCHAFEPYRTWEPDAGARLPVTESVAARVLCLPTGTAVSAEEVTRVCELIASAFEAAPEIRRTLAIA